MSSEANDQTTHQDGDTNNDPANDELDEAVEDEEESSKATPDKKRPFEDKAEDTANVDDEPMPTLPLKKARTAYFIFADEKREELKQLVRNLLSMKEFAS
jgi:hypothetical protein